MLKIDVVAKTNDGTLYSIMGISFSKKGDLYVFDKAKGGGKEVSLFNSS